MVVYLKKNKTETTLTEEPANTLLAVQNGTIVPVESLPDPVFAEKVLGDGYAIDPTDGKVLSPVSGTIIDIQDSLHAYGISTDDGLEVLVPSINTDGDNTSRFIVLSREKPTAGNRFSLLFTVDNKPGKLAEVIQVIGASGFNMESIKSRPMPHVPFEYYFYVELVGDAAAGETAALLRELDRTCRTVRLLGVYTK